MSNTNENKLVPKFRFPEFNKNGEWERTTIGEVGKFYYGKSAPKWSLSSDAPTPCVRYGELYTKFDTVISKVISRTNIDPSNLKFSKGGEILVPRVGEVPQEFAKNCCYLPFSNIAIGEMISVYETEEYPIFYTYYFRTMWRQFAKVVEGQNVKNLYYVNLEPIVIAKPSFSEQQKIASCLSSLDEVITAESQKLQVLKEHKKGLLQNLFPKTGETVPKLRFKEFADSGEWVEKSLGEVAEIITGNTPSTIVKEYYGGDLMFVSPADINDKRYVFKTKTTLTELGFSKTRKVKSDSVLFVCIGSTIGKVAQNKFECATNQQINSLVPHKEYSSHFIYSLLEANSEKIALLAGRQAVPIINKTLFSSVLLLFPKKTEQQKIAECLSSLDDLINTQSQKVETLKLHKKGLLQGLFPTIND